MNGSDWSGKKFEYEVGIAICELLEKGKKYNNRVEYVHGMLNQRRSHIILSRDYH